MESRTAIIEYDLNQVRKRFIDSGYLDTGGAFARALLHSAITGKQTLGQFLKHARQVAQKEDVIDLNAILMTFGTWRMTPLNGESNG